MSLTIKILTFGLCLILWGCGSKTDKPSETSITPMPGKVQNDLPDEKLVQAVNKFLKARALPLNSEYEMARIDLNNDGQRDGLILFKLPHNYWCGWDGCSMAVFQSGTKHFTPLGMMSGVRGPIWVTNQYSNGWKDIVVRVSGTKIRDKNIAMKYDGRRYPDSPMLAPTLHRPLSSLQAREFFR